jgi:hypothetical protein
MKTIYICGCSSDDHDSTSWLPSPTCVFALSNAWLARRAGVIFQAVQNQQSQPEYKGGTVFLLIWFSFQRFSNLMSAMHWLSAQLVVDGHILSNCRTAITDA